MGISVGVANPWKNTMFIGLFIVSCCVILILGESTESDKHEGIHIASWNWDHVGVFITITVFVVFSGLAKVGEKSYSSFLYSK